MLNSGLNIEKVEKISEERKEPFWMKDKRIMAFNAFGELALPQTDKLSNIFLINFDNIAIQKSRDEVYTSSDRSIAFEDLNVAIKKYPEIIKDKLMASCVNFLESKLAALHYAFWDEGVFLYIPKDTDAGILTLITKMSASSKFENILVIAEEGAKATIIEKSFSGQNPGYRSQIVEIFLGERAEIKYGSVQELNKSITNVSIKRAILGKDAVMNWIDCCSGSSFTFSEVSTVHAGRGANSKTLGAFFGEESQKFEFSINSFHKAQDTESRMIMKGMLKDRAKSLYCGLIDIDENGFRTVGYQREDALLLGNNAEANAIPKLQIKNNNVKCSHGTAIGQIDEEKRFYLMSRGLSEEDSKKIIVEGFFEPIIREMEIGEMKEKIKEIMAGKNKWSSSL